MNRKPLFDASAFVSLTLLVLAFGLDRAHKAFQVASDCIAWGEAYCVEYYMSFIPFSMSNWRGGEVVRVTDFFDYVLVWNTGVSYGMLDFLPVWGLSVIMIVAIIALSIWWWRADTMLIRTGLALCVGGALSNLIDRQLYGAVADFFHFHWQGWSFYIFNIADVAITFGVIFLLADVIGVQKWFTPRKDVA